MSPLVDKPSVLSDDEAREVRATWKPSADELGLTEAEWDDVWVGWSSAWRDATWDEAMLGMAEMKKRGLAP
jgi:hypothetical protein